MKGLRVEAEAGVASEHLLSSYPFVIGSQGPSRQWGLVNELPEAFGSPSDMHTGNKGLLSLAGVFSPGCGETAPFP